MRTKSAPIQGLYKFPNPYWYYPLWPHQIGATTAQTGVANRVFLTPQYFPFSFLSSRVRFRLSTLGGVGTFVKVGMYFDNGRTPAGGSLIFDSGNIIADASNRLVYNFSPALRIAAGMYWFAMETQDTTVAFSRYTDTVTINDEATEPLAGCHYNLGSFAALSSTCPSVTLNSGARLSTVWRVDSII